MNKNVSSLIGGKFGRLLVVSDAGRSPNRLKLYLCKCDCGKEVIVRANYLRSGHTKSCGCLQSEKASQAKIKHGQNRRGRVTPEYLCWREMKARCTTTAHPSYHRYGGRGISVCDRWIENFENFYADMGPKPSPNHSIDRYPNNATGNYEPNNCRWSTDEQQCNNRRSNRWLQYNLVEMTLSQWANYFGITHGAIYNHFKKGKDFYQIVDYYSKKSICANKASV